MPSKSHYFYIKSYLHGFCVTLEDEAAPGVPARMAPQLWHGENDRQLFYQDALTHTIRSFQDDLCLQIDTDDSDECAVLAPYEEGNVHQQWTVVSHFLYNLPTGKVLDVRGSDEGEGADVIAYDKHGLVNQKWEFEYVPRRYFYVVSQKSEDYGEDLVLDVRDGNADEGADVCLWTRHDEPADNQLWYTARDGVIRSKLNGFALWTGEEGDQYITLLPYQMHLKTMGFKFSDYCVVNLHNDDEDTRKVLDVSGRDAPKGARICEYAYHGGDNQRWRLKYEPSVE